MTSATSAAGLFGFILKLQLLGDRWVLGQSLVPTNNRDQPEAG